MKMKKGMRALSLLMVIVFVGVIFVPVVCASEELNSASKETKIEKNYITIDTAYEHACLAMQDFVDRGLVDISWINAEINCNPLEICDINGKKLFYSFPIKKNGENIGTIKIASSKVLGASVLTFGSETSFINEDELTLKSEEFIKKNYVDSKLVSMQTVCYRYPKIGLLLTFVNPEGDKNQIILDTSDYSQLSESDVSSFYDTIPESELSYRLSDWEEQQNYLRNHEVNNSSIKATVTETLSGFYLYPQEGTNWCCFATAQMISKYYGYNRSQQQIAQTIGVDPDDGATLNQVTNNYYKKSALSGGIGKTNTYTEWLTNAQFDTVKDEIDANHPVHTSRYEALSYHARVITGYSYVTDSGNEYVYIYDPWPVDLGGLYWENWNVFYSGSNPVHANVYVK